MVSAGFEVTSSESIVELGEFVTSIRPSQFKQLDSEGIQDSLGELSKHAKEFSRAQKTAIMETVSNKLVTCPICEFQRQKNQKVWFIGLERQHEVLIIFLDFILWHFLQLTEANFTDLLQQDLGDLAAEIPLSDLDEVVIEKDNLKQIGKQPWSRGQV